MALEEKNNFFILPQEIKHNKTVFNYWLGKHLNRLSYSEIEPLSIEQQTQVFEQRPQMLVSAVQNHNKLSYLLELEMEKDFFKYFSFLPGNWLEEKKFQNKILSKDKIKEQLSNWLEKYKSVSPFDKSETKLYQLCLKDEHLREKTKQNIFLQLNCLKLLNKKLDLEEFQRWSKDIINLYNQNKFSSDVARALIGRVKQSCTVETMKQLPRTKDLFEYLNAEYLTKQLEQNLETKTFTKRAKI